WRAAARSAPGPPNAAPYGHSKRPDAYGRRANSAALGSPSAGVARPARTDACKIRRAQNKRLRTDAGARAQPQRDLQTLDRRIVIARPRFHISAEIPAAGEARVERQRAIDNSDHCVEILTKSRQHIGGIGEGRSVLLIGEDCPAGIVHADAVIALPLFAPV